MKNIYILGFIFSLVFSGCIPTGYVAVPKSTKCPPPGTKISFAKLVTAGFAEDYVGCDIKTVVQFVAVGTGAWVLPVSTQGKAVFRALPPGAKGEKNPLSGEIQANMVVIPKESADLLFKLSEGDMVELTGGNYVKVLAKWARVAGAGSHSSIVFMADSMKKVESDTKN
ncbi:MAG: hypothetical protein KKI12_10270 [Proteobacteria bacterium]|nr:hypothetical protein [Pseudomonadota bacterium]MBU4257783.1 hypothetical protein [Pseudomonadota bacterium]MBU4288541.1 hypothetical protein [Pseudomonadota bacterium]MBU4414887.1 hypothetical protein [Pseudomonadota bacterium]MCG2759518.1 hypothetical protein [Desulfobacteraceae bacterium]